MRNNETLASLITGTAAADRFSVPNPSKIRKTELTALNKKTLTPRKHYEPLKYLLENDFFLEDARECILSILSVLEERYKQRPLESMKKAQNPPKTSSRGKNPYLIFSKQKNLRTKRLLKKVTTKMLLFSMTVVRRVVEMIALAVTQEVVKVIAKTESDLVLSPCETKHHV